MPTFSNHKEQVSIFQAICLKYEAETLFCNGLRSHIRSQHATNEGILKVIPSHAKLMVLSSNAIAASAILFFQLPID